MPRPFRSLFPLLPAVMAVHAAAQCVGPAIATFPAYEGFEAAPVWTVGGTNSDWAWGSPSHPYINSAGGGTNCWCAGGLTGASYNDDERAWIESPCYDFSTLDHPWISFKINWRLETQYDGMVLQYSLDEGATYDNVGAFGDPQDCLNANWYNADNVLNLSGASPRHGWSGGPTGSCQVGSSGGWITAKHCLTDLAHAPSVRFRFYFGAGHQCNNYDGAAIDDILVQNAPPNASAFTYSCTGNTVDFISQGTGCPVSFHWDFGDPVSGSGNLANTQNATHTFSGPGTYTISHLEASDCAGTSTTTQDITILDVTTQVSDAQCGPGSGSASVVVNNATTPHFLWDPDGQTTATITGLSGGQYTVTVTAPNACPFTWDAVVQENGIGMNVQGTSTNTTCPATTDGSASVIVSGGTPNYTYSWSPSGGDLS
ncbi:MAG TPA: PKD domain-containing protein, partial [Flavobacteriales bacterium]|nr:PKD domain-containing protein [Flavobacteriales bacterium]